jgi:uncharacterized protein (DUF983 family)
MLSISPETSNLEQKPFDSVRHSRFAEGNDASYALEVKVTRGEVAQRCLLLRCPNCGSGGQLRSWFRLHPSCPACGLKHSVEEGFTLGTTSIGYVVALIIVFLPVCVLVYFNLLPVWAGILAGIVGSVVVSIGMYPIFLGWVLMTYYVVNVEHLPANQPAPKIPPSQGVNPN